MGWGEKKVVGAAMGAPVAAEGLDENGGAKLVHGVGRLIRLRAA